MKKLLYSAVALATLLFASCQQESLETVQGGNAVVFTVEAPATALTKAIGDGTNVDQLIYEVWMTNKYGELTSGAQKLYQGEPVTMEVVNGVATATVTLDLVNDQKYTVLFWAQNGSAAAYNTAELTAVTYAKTEYLANDESLAAFYGVAYVNDSKHENKDGSAKSDNTVVLRRPFAQVNIGTLNTPSEYDVLLSRSKVTLSNVPTEFNVVNGEVDDEVSMTFNFNAVPNDPATLKVNNTPYEWAAMNYVFAGSNLIVKYDIETKVQSLGNETIVHVTHEIDQVPVKENYRTNIIGNLLSSNVKFNIVVDDSWDGYYVENQDDAAGETESFIAVDTPEEFLEIVELINSGDEDYKDVNLALDGDIDLSSFTFTRSAVASNWAPIGTPDNPFTGTFDGNGYTIKNLALVESEAKEGKAYIGFFGYAKNATIKNVTFENVYVNIPCLDIDHSQGHIGAVVGSLEGTCLVENVTVKGNIEVYATQTANGASRVAVVAGGNSYGDVTMKNVHVIANEGSSLIANNNTGALAGQLQGKIYFENCSSNINVTVNKFFAGGLIGLAPQDATFKNCLTTSDIAVVAGREGRANDQYRVGGIAGGWADGKNNVCTLINCSYTGTVSGKNADGSVAEVLDYAGYVGRGYTLANCAGSKVVIDGVEYVQKYHNVYGDYSVYYPVSTAEELVATLAAGNGVIFMNDITVAATKGGYNKAGILQNKAQAINGNGHTLKVTGAGATWDCAIYTNGGTIKNLTVAGAMRGIFTAGQSCDLNIENVTFKNVIYTFNSDGKMPANPFGVYVSNSKVNGWTSHSNMHTEVVYTNCSFGEGSGYKYCRPYGTTKFVNCTFCAGYTLDKSQTSDITLTNCTFAE